VQAGEHADHISRAITGCATRKRGRSYSTDSTPAKFGRPIRPRHKGEVSAQRLEFQFLCVVGEVISRVHYRAKKRRPEPSTRLSSRNGRKVLKRTPAAGSKDALPGTRSTVRSPGSYYSPLRSKESNSVGPSQLIVRRPDPTSGLVEVPRPRAHSRTLRAQAG